MSPGAGRGCPFPLVYVYYSVLLMWLLAASAAGQTLVPGAGPDDPVPYRHIYAVPKDGPFAGQLLVYVDNSSDTAPAWVAQAVPAPLITGVNWADFAYVFAGGDGVIYAV